MIKDKLLTQGNGKHYSPMRRKVETRLAGGASFDRRNMRGRQGEGEVLDRINKIYRTGGRQAKFLTELLRRAVKE